jgi:hypothetical protein
MDGISGDVHSAVFLRAEGVRKYWTTPPNMPTAPMISKLRRGAVASPTAETILKVTFTSPSFAMTVPVEAPFWFPCNDSQLRFSLFEQSQIKDRLMRNPDLFLCRLPEEKLHWSLQGGCSFFFNNLNPSNEKKSEKLRKVRRIRSQNARYSVDQFTRRPRPSCYASTPKVKSFPTGTLFAIPKHYV